MIKRTELVSKISGIIEEMIELSKTDANGATASYIAEKILTGVESVMDPKVRPLTEAEVEDHVLVKQVHHSRKDEVRNYVRSLEYEWKRQYLPEDK